MSRNLTKAESLKFARTGVFRVLDGSNPLKISHGVFKAFKPGLCRSSDRSRDQIYRNQGVLPGIEV